MKTRFFIIFRIAVSVGLIVWLIHLAQTANLVEALAGANLILIGLVLLVANVDRVLMAYKWNLLLRAKQINLPLIGVVAAYYKASFWGNMILPSIGADAIRIFEVSKRTKKPGDIISSVIIERIIGLLAITIVGFIGLVIFSLTIGRNWGIYVFFLAAILLGSIPSFLLTLNRRRFIWLQNWLSKSEWETVRRLERVIISYQEYSRFPRTLWIFFFLSCIEQLFPVFSAYLIALALSINNLSFITLLIFVPLILLIVRLPISMDGFGVTEGLYIYIFGLIGVQPAHAFLLGFLPAVLARVATAMPTLYFFLMQSSGLDPSELEAQKVILQKEVDSKL